MPSTLGCSQAKQLREDSHLTEVAIGRQSLGCADHTARRRRPDDPLPVRKELRKPGPAVSLTAGANELRFYW
ncbi:MAG TPA: hypothetical protein VMU39_14305 [Solirubrobacteraceae bacterium]|nr:hypothetical protein [Solirubrobacteraceae bacterium]